MFLFCSGLDSSTSLQCLKLLKRLSQDGRTIICTIHQPSALMFEMFDQLYTLTNGYCIYQGRVKDLIPFFKEIDLECPSYHNPADFRNTIHMIAFHSIISLSYFYVSVMEIAAGEYGTEIETIAAVAQKKYIKDKQHGEKTNRK